MVLDRGFFSAWVFNRLLTGCAQRHFLIRLRTDFKDRVVKRLGPGDELVELRVSREARKKHPELPDTMQLRRLSCQRKGFRKQAVLTSLRSQSVEAVEQEA